ncbi:TetR/AcrR family transcriptional regulator [Rhizobium sp. TH2]|uniref:TetR/AcrR family transcriptional regulator n=1 Tax=Rhizobium sp. TH2 TaxID=2775403 RepID=UPI002158052C|nr:TetR/AcrR family transcriptional regulator [Rhizobium sp. TH2]UVC11378.1 TetR/AcrR family transcriptional regulator [Rhizobium sp. TH2]
MQTQHIVVDAAPPRNRDATRARILKAAAELLAEDGFQNFGVNAVARRAGCDKQLIYRYYGGMDGLVDVIGGELARWMEEKMPVGGSSGFMLTYGDLIEHVMLLFMEALRDDPLTRRIIAWEVSDNSPQVRRLSEARSRALGVWIEKVRGKMPPPRGVDHLALNAMLLAAVQHVVLAGATAGRFAGLELSGEKDWDRVALAVRKLVRGVYP